MKGQKNHMPHLSGGNLHSEKDEFAYEGKTSEVQFPV